MPLVEFVLYRRGELFQVEINLTHQQIPPCSIRVMMQQGILYKRLEVLDRSHRGYLLLIMRLCNELDESLQDFSNVLKIQTQQNQLDSAWEQYCACCDKYADLIDTVWKSLERP